jgi:hypothetical protein
VGSFAKSDETFVAAFFDLDKTIISRSSTLAFGPSFCRHGLITGAEALRTAYAQLVGRIGRADYQRESARRSASCAGAGRPGHRHRPPVPGRDDPPACVRRRPPSDSRSRQAGQDVIIVSTSGQ